MKNYPLESISIEQAQQKQFRMIECITKYFTGTQILNMGDLGVHQPENQPLTTNKVEKVIADFFNAEACILVRGSGTGAIRYGISAAVNAGETVLIHDAPVYSTTATSFEMFGIKTVTADFNDLDDIRKVMGGHPEIKAALVQHSRQTTDDSYILEEVINTIHSISAVPIITDDNYAVMKVSRIGVELGSELSCFSTFKLLGPEGIGCVVGKKTYIDKIHRMHYSGGCQTQGWEAMAVLRGLVYSPVMLAISAQELEKTCKRLESGEIPGIKSVCVANSQSKVLLVELEKPIAKKVLVEAEKLGALPNPVGSESKYDLTPLFYRVSGTFLKTNPEYADTIVRINPNRAGSDLIINILKESMRRALEEQE